MHLLKSRATENHIDTTTPPSPTKHTFFGPARLLVKPSATTTSPPPTKHTFFGRSRSPVRPPVVDNHGQNGVERKGSIFSRRRSTSTLSDPASSSSHSGFFGRSSSTNHHNDPTIVSARDKVASAEAREKEADQALIQARMAVKEAREHVKILEKEAALDAKRAKAKQLVAEDISKHAQGLGRHG